MRGFSSIFYSLGNSWLSGMEPTGDPQRTSEAQYGVNQQPFPAGVNQVNLPSSTSITDQKGKIHMSVVKNVKHGKSLLRNRLLRLEKNVRALKTVLREANDLPDQLKKLESLEPDFKRIKLDITSISSLPESQAGLKLVEVECSLGSCLETLSEVRGKLSKARRQQSLVHKLGEYFLHNEEYSTETLEEKFCSAVAATDDPALLPSLEALSPTFSNFDFQIYENDKDLHGIPLGNTITNGTIQQGGSEATEAQYNKNAPPLSHSDNQTNLMLSGSNKRAGEMGKDPFKMVEPNRSSHRDNGVINMIPTPGAPNGANRQPLPPDDIQGNYSSPMSARGKKRNQKAKGQGIKKQCRPQVTGESSHLGEDNLEEHFWGYNEETPKNKEFSLETLGKEKEFYSPVPSMQVVAPTFGHESLSTSGDMDIPNCGIDNGPHGMPLGNTITSGMLQQGESEASEAQYNMNTPPLSHSIETLGKEDKTALSEAGGQGIDIDDVIPIDQDSGSSLARKMMRHEYNSWKLQHFNEDNDKVDAAGFPALEQASKVYEFFRQNIEVLVCNTTKEMQYWYTPKDSGWDQLKNWKATLNLAKTIGGEVKFADDMLEYISLACFAYSMISGVQGTDINGVIPIDQDNGSLLARNMMLREYSSWNFQHFNEDNDKVALEQASQDTEFFCQNINVLVSNTIKEMQEWCTPKDSGWDQLKNWKVTLNLAKTIGGEVKIADDVLENISLACFAYSMISGEG